MARGPSTVKKTKNVGRQKLSECTGDAVGIPGAREKLVPYAGRATDTIYKSFRITEPPKFTFLITDRAPVNRN